MSVERTKNPAGRRLQQLVNPRAIGRKLLKPFKGNRQVSVAPSEILIKHMAADDINPIVRTFKAWNKQRDQFERYLEEQQRDERTVLVVYHGSKVVGYGTIVWEPDYELFRRQRIPEIVDLNVITEYQGAGIGSALISALERVALERHKPQMGISVEQTPQYAKANRLYPRLGYVPDGQGTERDNHLHLIKPLTSGE
jgi:GNAT superfamily N-acetyltransferase